MDPVLARMFDLDRPLHERFLDRELKEDFVKCASEVGIDLTKLAEDEVELLWKYHSGYRRAQMLQLAKEAEAERIGRLLARNMMDQWMRKTADPAAFRFTDIPIEEAMPGRIPFQHRVLTDDAVFELIMKRPASLIEGAASGVIAPHEYKAFYRPLITDPSVRRYLDREVEKAFTQTGARARMAALRSGVPAGLTPRSMVARIVQAGDIGLPPPPAAESFWSQLSPKGITRALKAGDWGRVALKGLPLAGLGLGAAALLKRHADEEREKQLALASMAGTPPMLPAAGLPAGPGAALS